MRRSDRAEARTPAVTLPRDRMLRAIIPPALFALAVTCGGEDGQQVTPRCTDANPCALGGGGGGGVTPDGNSGRGGSSAGSGTGGAGTNGAGGGGTTSDASAGSESGGTAGAG